MGWIVSEDKALIFRLQSELYPHEVLFWVGPRPDSDALGYLCKRRGLWNGEGKPPDVGDGAAATLHFKHGCFVWLDSAMIKDGPKFMGTFVHELMHVMSHASDYLGIRFNGDTDEFHAYYAGWITKEAMKCIFGRLCK